MEELFFTGFALLLLGSSVFFWYYPIYTIFFVGATVTISYKFWRKFKNKLLLEEKTSRMLGFVNKYPSISAVYIPNFEKTISNEIKNLKKRLKKKNQTEVISFVESVEELINTHIIPQKSSIEESLEHYIYTNHEVLDAELKQKEIDLKRTNDPQMASVLQKTIENLKEKKEILKKTEEEIIYFYSQLKNILYQVENMSLKSMRLQSSNELLLDLKQDISDAFEGFEDANSLLDDLSKI